MKKISKRVVALNFPPVNKTGISLNQVTRNNLYSSFCGNPDYEDNVYMSSDSYKEIFRKLRSQTSVCKRRLSVVKITSPITHRSIWRKYVYNPNFSGITDELLVLNPASIRELGENKCIVGSEVIVQKGSVLKYFWKHPFHATRISTKLGVISVVLAVISIVITVLLSCHCCC